MFETVLVANRGEIAVRVMRACEELGIDTVAIYSEADSAAGHVRYADEAYNVGPARAADSYLDQEAIIDAAEKANADAIHPGYGFLAENADFAAAVEDSDATWVGPTSESMRQLGEKTNARRAMSQADVPIVPGTTDPVTDPDEVTAFGDEYGYPVAIKAEGGGGGRGMKVVESADEAADQLESAKREGAAYFDNDSVYLERYLDGPRHIEVQIIADHHGDVCHVGERDCSLQRRHQKLIEEAPSPALSDALREKIREAARRGADAADYHNAGTFEFLVEDGDRAENGLLGEDTDFYFLEVNTRIQVEHTVSEALTGIDLVKNQLLVAVGEQLEFAQEDVSLDGHAMEFRINAENAAEEFAPATGSLEIYDPPGGIGVRIDDALRQGDTVGGEYDSMIAKLIVYAQNREECIARSKRALSEYDIEGLLTVIPFHRLMLEDDQFVAGEHTTDYLDEEFDRSRMVEAQERWGPEEAAGGADEANEEVTQREFVIEVNGKRFEVDLEERGAPPIPTGNGGSNARSRSGSNAGGRSGSGGSGSSSGGGSGGSGGSGATAEGQQVTAEMQGTILEVTVAEGEEVAAGDVLCVLEAMKMENDVVAPRGGTVAEIPVAADESVDMGDVLVVLD